MKRLLCTTVFLFVFLSPKAQEINFTAYDNITDQSFKQFLSLFSKRNLPISTDDIVSELDIWNLKSSPLNDKLISKYLISEGDSIFGPLYDEYPADNRPPRSIYGSFFPLYKLPTNGNYVMLAFAQTDDTDRGCDEIVFVVSFDLAGNFIYLTSYLFLQPRLGQLNSYIDENLQSHLVYVYLETDGERSAPPLDHIFLADEAHRINQINSNGRAVKVSFNRTPGNFQFNGNECRFKRVN